MPRVKLDLKHDFSVLLARIEELAAERGRVVVAIDGRCASGKTTLAGKLAEALSADVFHMDDFFLPPEKRTEQRLATPGGNCDCERFLEEVLLPLSRGGGIAYRPFSCKFGDYLTRVEVIPSKIVIVEGSYSCHPSLFSYYDLTIFVYISEEKQIERLERRGGSACLEQFKNKWIPLEEAYFSAFSIKAKCDIVIQNE